MPANRLPLNSTQLTSHHHPFQTLGSRTIGRFGKPDMLHCCIASSVKLSAWKGNKKTFLLKYIIAFLRTSYTTYFKHILNIYPYSVIINKSTSLIRPQNKSEQHCHSTTKHTTTPDLITTLKVCMCTCVCV